MSDLDEQVNEILERRKRELEEAEAEAAAEDFDADEDLGYDESIAVEAGDDEPQDTDSTGDSED